MTDKLTTYLYHEDALDGWAITGEEDGLVAAFLSYARELKDGEVMEFHVWRHDMTRLEIDAAPVQ